MKVLKVIRSLADLQITMVIVTHVDELCREIFPDRVIFDGSGCGSAAERKAGMTFLRPIMQESGSSSDGSVSGRLAWRLLNTG